MVKVSDQSWKGTAHSFIIHWKDQIHQYEELTLLDSVNRHFLDGQKCAMLEAAIMDLSDLEKFCEQEDMQIQKGMLALTYEGYT
jgi:hypothetical protein